MKKTIKIISIILLSIVLVFTVYIAEESIRIQKKTDALPLIVTDRTKTCITCIEPGEETEIEYWSVGYKIKVRYYLSEESSDDNKIVQVIGKEFLLFNKIQLWAWIS